MKKRRLKILLIVFILLAVAFCAARWIIVPYVFYSEGTVRDPVQYAERVKAWKEYEIEFDRDGEQLHGWLVEKGTPKLLVWYGGKSRLGAGYMESAMPRLPYSFLYVDYRGFGRSTGTPSEAALVQDALHVLDRVVKSSGRSYDDIVLVGESLGSGIAVQVAASRPVGRLVLIVPFDSIANVADGIVPPLPLSAFLRDQYRSDLYVARVNAPVAIFGGGEDNVVPASHARRLADVFRQSRPDAAASVFYREYPAAGHNNLTRQPGFWDDLEKILED